MLLNPSIALWTVVGGLLLYRCYRFLFDRPPNFPSGPPRFPLLGGYLVMLLVNYKHLHKAALKLSEFYRTSILGLYLGDFPTVVVNDLWIAKEVLNRTEFDGRSDLFLARLRDRNFERRGIFFTLGPHWKEQRRFVLRHLRDFGFGRRFEELEAETQHEVTDLLEVIKYGAKFEHEQEFVTGDGFVRCPDVFYGCLANIYCQVVCGERFQRKDMAVLFEMGQHGLVFQQKGDDYGTILSYLPWLKDYFPETTNYRILREVNLKMNDFIEQLLNKFLASYDESHIRCFLDRYIREMKESTPLQGQSFTFQYDQLVMILWDLLVPTVSGSAVQLSMLIQRLILNPRVATKVQQELDEVVGRGRLPTLDDRILLPYTEATLRETLRIDTLVPSGIAHMAMENTTLRGYDIPEGTFVILGLDVIHHQKEAWGDPENFRPERFLDECGKLSLAKDISVPFGAGKRLCVGETFARNTLFLMFTAVMQNFTIHQRPKEPLPDIGKRITGVVTSMEPFWIRFEPR
ncbi:probable cytochrome P450 304a1 [Toxorhynchites rutilus septentrionalis]|uniref:probable cytochrome P450 304a1 n=1 Tax=Toxorhynchites rutilus septentrionalis TaxID=329112 RepID=UPI002479FEDE|nr:probable cytochrome P450 304a1 [Toxorhynchites rutilus septentrionalis]